MLHQRKRKRKRRHRQKQQWKKVRALKGTVTEARCDPGRTDDFVEGEGGNGNCM